MLLLRRDARALARLSQLSSSAWAAPATAASAADCLPGPSGSSRSDSSRCCADTRAAALSGWQHTAVRRAWGAAGGSSGDGKGDDGGGPPSGRGGMASWLASKIGGGGEQKLEDLDLDTFHSSLKAARRLQSMASFLPGSAGAAASESIGSLLGAGAPMASGEALQQFQSIIEAMRPEERKDLSLFDAAARRRVAAEVGVTTQQVDDCIARFLWTKRLLTKSGEMQKSGQAMPGSIDEVEAMLGNWRQYRTEQPASAGSAKPPRVPPGHIGFRGQLCPLAGRPGVAKQTKCPASKKAFIKCCGPGLKAGTAA